MHHVGRQRPGERHPRGQDQDAPLHHLLPLLAADVRHVARSIEVVSAWARSVYNHPTGKAKFSAIKTCFNVKSLFFELKICFSHFFALKIFVSV